MVIDNSGTHLKRVDNLYANIKQEEKSMTVTIVDEEFGQKHAYLISLERLWISLEVDDEPVLTVNPHYSSQDAANLPGSPFYMESIKESQKIEEDPLKCSTTSGRDGKIVYKENIDY
jgi:hypothetical protein